MSLFRCAMDYSSCHILRSDEFHNLIDTSGVDMLQCTGLWFLLHNVSTYQWLERHKNLRYKT